MTRSEGLTSQYAGEIRAAMDNTSNGKFVLVDETATIQLWKYEENSGTAVRWTPTTGSLMAEVRVASFGEDHRLSVVDRFGTWLSQRKLRSELGDLRGAVLADVGCGYDARFGMSRIAELDRLIAVDVSLSRTVRASEDRILARILAGCCSPDLDWLGSLCRPELGARASRRTGRIAQAIATYR